MTHPSRRHALVAGLCLALVAGSCSAPDDPSTGAPDRVTAVVLPYLTLMPFYIAAEEGYFAEQNLDVDFLRLGRNQDFMAALAQGDVDVTAGMLALNELSLVASGARLRVVAALNELSPDGCAYLAIVARRELLESGALQDREQIRSLRFDISPFVPLGYTMDELLRTFDLTLDDVDTVDLPPPAAVEMLRRGDIDVTADAEPFVSTHIATGEAVIWRSLAELTEDYVSSVLMFGPTLLDERPEVGARFTTAILKAVRQFRQGKTPRNLSIAEAALGLTPAQLELACWPVPSDDARVRASAFLGYQQWLVARGLLDRVLAEDELLDHRFIDLANAELAR